MSQCSCLTDEQTQKRRRDERRRREEEGSDWRCERRWRRGGKARTREREEATKDTMPPDYIINTATSYQIATHSGPDLALFWCWSAGFWPNPSQGLLPFESQKRLLQWAVYAKPPQTHRFNHSLTGGTELIMVKLIKRHRCVQMCKYKREFVNACTQFSVSLWFSANVCECS